MFIDNCNTKQLAILHRASDDVRTVGHTRDDSATAKAIARALGSLLELGATLGLEPQELINGELCNGCGREVLDFRRSLGRIICSVCAHERMLDAAPSDSKTKGLSNDTVNAIRREILGIDYARRTSDAAVAFAATSHQPESAPTPATATRASTLADAQAATTDRADKYGTPAAAFEAIAYHWSGIVNAPITAVEVALMLATMKVVRARNNPQHADSWTDLAGYAACGAEIARATKGEAA